MHGFSKDEIGSLTPIIEDFADIGLCDNECDDEVPNYDQGGVGTSHDHRNHATLQQPTPNCQPTDATSCSSFDTAVGFSSALQQPSSTDGAPVQQPLAGRADPQASIENMGRGFRTKYPSVKLRDHVTHTVFASSPSLPASVSDHPSGTPYPLAHYIHCVNFSVHY